MAKLVEKELSYKVVGLLYKTQRELGRYCKERHYGDHFENLLKKEGMKFVREYPIELDGRKSNFVDFFIEDTLLVDFKCKPFLTKEDYYQMRRYLEITKKELGLIVNFRNRYLKPKRVLNTKLYHSEHSDKFGD